MGSVDDATIALRIKRLVMAPSSEAGLAENKLSTAVVKFLPLKLIFLKVSWENTLPFRSKNLG